MTKRRNVGDFAIQYGPRIILIAIMVMHALCPIGQRKYL
jgi:hypothetical protein